MKQFNDLPDWATGTLTVVRCLQSRTFSF